MSQIIGVDLGGTKLHAALFSDRGDVTAERVVFLEERRGYQVSDLLVEVCRSLLEEQQVPHDTEKRIGICVPGIANEKTGSVWAPNIPGWSDFPLKQYVTDAFPDSKTYIASDRVCYILGEQARGVARGMENAIYVSVGTGIGAGIITEGRILNGASGIAGAIGWMALGQPFHEEYSLCGYFETYASGVGMAARARTLSGEPQTFPDTQAVFRAYDLGHPAAITVVDKAIECWGMAAANLISLFNPEIIVWGGGVFGPAVRFLDRIQAQARQWAQPIAITSCCFQPSALSGRAGLYGAGSLVLQSIQIHEKK